ncbi:hypothetical protein [Burkholderia cepacia]|uniref:hypothetical protein n=1 Tax=Burkholderia cepacia TaxID=292 RepID=UPI0018C8BEAB|nr:hypothetical protein [Burkholderia cepacia]
MKNVAATRYGKKSVVRPPWAGLSVMNGARDGKTEDTDRQRMRESTGNRDEWRYYPEGPAPRSAAHAVRMDFMRIDFYDDFVVRSQKGAHRSGRQGSSKDRRMQQGIFAGKRHLSNIFDERRSSSIIETSPLNVSTSTGR